MLISFIIVSSALGVEVKEKVLTKYCASSIVKMNEILIEFINE